MLIPNQQVQDTLSHWIGDTKLSKPAFVTSRKSIHSNELAADLLNSFGNSTIHGFVGFVDLAGFSTATCKKSAQEIAEYVSPFFNKIVPIITGRHAMIDKLIGDEIMFILPEYLGLDRTVTTLFLGQMLGGLHDAAIELAPEYRFRIGISYGPLYLSRICAGGYTEWTVFGEPVNIAKRLHGLPQLENPDPVAGAFGLQSVGTEPDDSELEYFSQTLAGFASRWELYVPEASSELKGVGHVRWSSFTSARRGGLDDGD